MEKKPKGNENKKSKILRKNAHKWNLLGDDNYKEGNFKDALNYYICALKLDPDNDTYMYNKKKAEIALDQINPKTNSGMNANEDKIIKQNRAKNGTTSTNYKSKTSKKSNFNFKQARKWNIIGDRHYKNEEYDDALNSYMYALSFDPDNNAYRNNKLKAEYALKNIDKMRIQQAKINDQKGRQWNLNGNRHYTMGEFNEALKSYLLALNFDPDNETYVRNKQAVLLELSKRAPLKPPVAPIFNMDDMDSMKKSSHNIEKGDTFLEKRSIAGYHYNP